MCVCNEGYWGSSCDKQCPGGALSPCYNHGICSKTTGKCECEPKWRGDLNCSTCGPGWTGQNCSLVVTPRSNVSAICTGYGSIITLDGVGYKIEESGEHVLFSFNDLKILINIVPCYHTRRCINAIALVFMTSTIVIHAPYENGGDPIVWVDKVKSSSLETVFQSNHNVFVLTRVSLEHFRLISKNNLLLDMRIFGRYIDLTITVVNSTWCLHSMGLWGNCDGNILNDFNKRNRQNIYQNLSTIHEVSQDYINNFVRSWKIKDNSTSVFIFESNELNEPRFKTDSGYSVRFKDSGLTCRNLFTMSGGDVTMEMMVKWDGIDGCLFSYATTSTLSIVIKTTVRLYYGTQEFDTLLQLQKKQWNTIVLIWRKTNRAIQFVLIEDSNRNHVRNFRLSGEQDIFASGGTLGLGYWYPTGGVTTLIPGAFVGEIDEVRIWNVRRSVADILSSRNSALKCELQGLANLWRFDEGQGNIAKDCVSGALFHFPAQGNKPTWVFSTFHLTIREIRKSSHQERSAVEDVCRNEIFVKAEGECHNIDDKVKIFFAVACYELMSSSTDIEKRLWSAVTYLDYCKASLGLPEWPGKSYCFELQSLSLPNWMKLSCQQSCKFGSSVNSDICKCEYGFYGKNCSRECPGGNISPCGGFSDCDKISGACSCPLNANVSGDCLTCSSGWRGEQCSIAATKNVREESTRPICQVYGAVHITTFDGSNYDAKAAGEFYLIRIDDFITQIRNEPCLNSSICTSAVALRLQEVNVTIRASYEERGLPLLYIDQYKTDYTIEKSIKGGYRFRQKQPGLFEVTKDSIPIIEVRMQEKYLSFSLFSDVKTCLDSSGLCSSCDNNTENDFVITNELRRRKRATNAERESTSAFVQKWNVLPPDSMFVYKEKEKREISISEYCLQYNGTSIETQAIYDSFTTSEDVTCELFVKIEKRGGTILSYAAQTTFGIINDETIKIQFGDNVLDTGIRMIFGQWYWLTITFSRTTRIMRVYSLQADGVMYNRILLVPYEIFTSGGVLSIGHWQSTGSGVTIVNRKPFYGLIDELRIWNITIQPEFVKQSRDRYIKYKVPGLLSLWLFDEGEGTIAHDIISGRDFTFPIKINARPSWVFSYARTTIPNISIDNLIWKNNSLKKEAEDLCNKFIMNDLHASKCGSRLGLAHGQYYYTSCLNDVKSSNAISSAFQSIVNYADYCQNILQLKTWPLDKYCNDLPKQYIGVHKGVHCNITCVFGHVESEICVCNTGYWGKNCSFVCPEGALNPCNRRGVCSPVTGRCSCEYNWQGNENCTGCSLGWEGSDCNVASATHGNASSVGLTGGNYQTFDGIRFTFFATGEFKVLVSFEIIIHTRQVPCYNGQSRCIDGLAFLLEDKDELVILASVPGEGNCLIL